MWAMSARLEVLAQRLANHGRRRFMTPSRSLLECYAQLRVKPYGFHARRRRADRWAAAAPSQCLIDVVASLGLLRVPLDKLVGDWRAARRLAVGLPRHDQASGSSRA